MAATGKLEVDVEVKSSPEKFWTAVRDSANIFPKAFPQQYKSIEILEGDGKAVGSVRLITYAEGVPLVKISKEKIIEVDEASKMAAYTVLEGELLEVYKKFTAKLVVSAKGEGSIVKWSCEYEKAKEELPPPDLILDFAKSNFKELDAYILQTQA